MIHTYRFLILATVALFFLAAQAQAHRVIVFAYAENGQIHVEGSFPGGKPAQNVSVVVASPSGTTFLEGRTDDQGRFSFPFPGTAVAERSDLLIVLDAGLGHKAQWTVPADEYLAGGQAQAPSAKPSEPPAPSATASEPAPVQPRASGVTMDEEALARLVADMVDARLESRLGPLTHLLDKAFQQGPGLVEVFGGLGWIIGLAGLYAWGRSKAR